MSKKVKAKAKKPVAPKSKLNAAQKIVALENQVLKLEKLISTNQGILADEIDRLGEVIAALGNRVNATIKASEEGNISLERVEELMMGENIKELKSKVDFLIERKVLTRDDEAAISSKSFLICRELKDGQIINPRLQFAMASMSDELQAPFVGKKVGDVIKTDNSNIVTEVLESYTITPPQINNNFEEEAPAENEEVADADPKEQEVEATKN